MPGLRKFVLTALTLVGLLGACSPPDDGTSDSPDDDIAANPGDGEPVAVINGHPITGADLRAHAGMDEDSDRVESDELLEERISLELLRQEAIRRGLDRDAETRRILRLVETNLLASLLLERLTRELEISREDIRAEYERQIEAMRGTEYRARHILVEKEGNARNLLARLDEGADFAELAEAHSLDPGSGARGGELDWFVPQQMVPAFSEAAAALQPGETTDQPVRSQFGWHIIRLEETHAARVPELKAVRAELVEILENRAIQEYLEDLRTQARIEIPARETD